MLKSPRLWTVAHYHLVEVEKIRGICLPGIFWKSPFHLRVVFKLGQQILGHELVCPEVYALLLGRRLTPALLWTWELL